MKFSNRTQHKKRPKLLTLVLSLMLIATMAIPIVSSNTLEETKTSNTGIVVDANSHHGNTNS